ncbi:MAG: RNA polymerase factor sigma-32 [Deltaproteobacteria bacterium]|nr:RNA polymerase factor sigma-32 [Deltaproteobacteria bacterium]
MKPKIRKKSGPKAPLDQTDLKKESTSKALVPVSHEEALPVPIDALHQYLMEVSRYPLLSREEEAEIAGHYFEHHDPESAKKLVVSNLRLVVKIAMEYSRAFHNILDLIQEGNIGLLRAVKKYDPSKGARFSYYAAWWIRAYILKFIVDNFRLVRLGTTQAQKKLFYNLMKEKRKIESMGFSPDSKLLAEKMDVKEKEVIEMEQRMGASDMSLDAPLSHYDGKLNIDMFASNETPADQQVMDEELKNQLFSNLEEFVATLREKEKKIFRERLYAEVPKTLQDIADEYGITRERIRQLEERVVSKLKEFFKGKGFEVDLNK